MATILTAPYAVDYKNYKPDKAKVEPSNYKPETSRREPSTCKHDYVIRENEKYDVCSDLQSICNHDFYLQYWNPDNEIAKGTIIILLK